MSFANNTAYRAKDIPQIDPAGRDVVVVIVKATFSIDDDGTLSPAEKPAAIRMAEELLDKEIVESSLTYPSDVCIEKRGTDLVVLGEALSPTPVRVMDVVVRAGGRTTTVRVHGERVFYKTLMGVGISEAAPFTEKPIVYERAYGGMTEDLSVIETRNPAGVGVAKRAADLIDTRAPQIELPSKPHTSAGDKHAPVGLGAIRSHWSPRREHIGTWDSAWETTRAPLMPIDFDVRCNNVAHPSLLFENGLGPGEPISIAGMSPRGLVTFSVPDVRATIHARYEKTGRVLVPPSLDTILVEPKTRRVEVVLRKTFWSGRGSDVLRELRVEPS